MTSTFSSSKSSHSLVRNNHAIELKEIEAKKGTLLALENALKKKISEFRELCLKEGVSIMFKERDLPTVYFQTSS